MVTKKLNTKARTEWPGGTAERDVHLLFQADGPCVGWILRIAGGPGSWYLSTLMERDGLKCTRLAIDFGQNWYCTNADELLAEAITLA